MSFSPIASHKKTINLSPTNNIENNILNTELEQKFSFSSLNPYEKNINENEIKKNNNYEITNKQLEIISDEMSKELNHINQKNYYKNENINMNNQIDDHAIKNSEEKKIENLEKIVNTNANKNMDLNPGNSFTELKEIKDKNSKIENRKSDTIINRNQNIFKTKSTPKINPYLKHKNIQSQINLNSKKENKNITNTIAQKVKNENKKIGKITKLVKKGEILDILNTDLDKEEKKIEKKSFMEDFILPNDIKKECLIELNKIDKNKNEKKIIENNQLKYGNPATTRENRNIIYKNLKNNNQIQSQNKKGKKILKMKKMENYKDNLSHIRGNKMYSNDFLSHPGKLKANINVKDNYYSETNLKFIPYYKEIYG